ncbi:hypothetical protein LWI28_016519 [Acer negundo]|uniref:Uncharacterized protein n=1 Tax=Acer negundo TaxID=4023 RepID=A0AAD5JL87_ACENE|nr:hypothetical protein LWI28_016519 [Acer negundo]
MGSLTGCDPTSQGSRLVTCISSNRVVSDACASTMYLIRFFFGLLCLTILFLVMGVMISEGIECRSSDKNVEVEGYVDDLKTDPHGTCLRSSAETHREVYLAHWLGTMPTDPSDAISRSLQLLKTVAKFLEWVLVDYV